MLAVGGILMAVSPYLTWVSFSGVVNVDLFGLVQMASFKQLLAYSPLIFGLILIGSVAICITYVSVLRTLAITYSLLLPIGGGVAIVQLYRAVSNSQGALHFGIGFIALGAAEVLFLVAGLYPSESGVDTVAIPDRSGKVMTPKAGASGATASVSTKETPSTLLDMNDSVFVGHETMTLDDLNIVNRSRCVTCQRELDPDFQYCPTCGTAAKILVKSHCEECLGMVEGDDIFCHSCGHKLS